MTNKKTNEHVPMVAKTIYGLENILAKELKDLGALDITTQNRSVKFWGDKELLYKANIHLRTASRILVPLTTFTISSRDDYYENIRDINWLDLFSNDQTFAIDALVNFSRTFDNSMYAGQLAKDAIVDQFREETGARPSVDTEDPDIQINIHISKNVITVSLDSSGVPLHKRGYRVELSKAPMNENLAAGLLLLAGYNGDRPFVDPMCGSGTIPIEAAMIALDMAPSLYRKKFAFMKWNNYDHNLYESVINKAKDSMKTNLNFPILGSDKDKYVIEKAKNNAKRVHLQNLITFEKIRFENNLPPEPPGMLLTNPPYGERLDVAAIDALYSMIGDSLKQNFTGYDAYIFSGNLGAVKHVGLKPSMKLKMFNGPIECRLLRYEMYQGSKKNR